MPIRHESVAGPPGLQGSASRSSEYERVQGVFDCDCGKDVESIAILSRENSQFAIQRSEWADNLATHLRHHVESREPREPAGCHSELLQPEPNLGEETEMSITDDGGPF